MSRLERLKGIACLNEVINIFKSIYTVLSIFKLSELKVHIWLIQEKVGEIGKITRRFYCKFEFLIKIL